MSDESMEEWSDLERAVAREDWDAALTSAEEFDTQWRDVRGIADLFVGPGADGWSKVVDEALEALLAALSRRPGSRVGVEAAMKRMRKILGEYGARS